MINGKHWKFYQTIEQKNLSLTIHKSCNPHITKLNPVFNQQILLVFQIIFSQLT